MPHTAKVAYALSEHWREALIVAVPLALLALAFAVEPIAQDPAYHQFADRRDFFGVPNALNVASNLAFLAVGVAGIARGMRSGLTGARWAWMTLFSGALLVALGSGYYHWAPDSKALVWDRLPMTLGFMGLFVALLAEYVDERLEKPLLVPALVLGAASVLWWRLSGDLRFYAWVQFMPLVTLPLLVALFRGRYTGRAYLLYALACYVGAKIAEALDRPVLEASGGWVSGHTLKHLLAALALFFIYLMLCRRERIDFEIGEARARAQ